MSKTKRIASAIVAALFAAFMLGACSPSVPAGNASSGASASASASLSVSAEASGGQASNRSIDYSPPSGISVAKDGQYTDKDHVALYIHTYGKVPSNYVTKSKARKAGWVNTDGNLWDVLPGKSIGGGGFHNDDGTLPDAFGREWYECDIDYDGGFRNAKRIVYSNDGLIFYTDDHYNTFEQLY